MDYEVQRLRNIAAIDAKREEIFGVSIVQFPEVHKGGPKKRSVIDVTKRRSQPARVACKNVNYHEYDNDTDSSGYHSSTNSSLEGHESESEYDSDNFDGNGSDGSMRSCGSED